MKIQLIQNGQLPIKGSVEAGAFDVFAREIEYTEKYVQVRLGFKTRIPKNFKALLIARSSITKTGWMLANNIGLIDSDYTGEWIMRFVPICDIKEVEISPNLFKPELVLPSPFPYTVGDRCGQFFLQKVEETIFDIVDDLEVSERGDGGFGSTGK